MKRESEQKAAAFPWQPEQLDTRRPGVSLKKTPGSCKYAWKKFALFRNRALKRHDKNEASLERIRKFGNSEYYHTVFMCVLCKEDVGIL